MRMLDPFRRASGARIADGFSVFARSSSISRESASMLEVHDRIAHPRSLGRITVAKAPGVSSAAKAAA